MPGSSKTIWASAIPRPTGIEISRNQAYPLWKLSRDEHEVFITTETGEWQLTVQAGIASSSRKAWLRPATDGTEEQQPDYVQLPMPTIIANACPAFGEQYKLGKVISLTVDGVVEVKR